TRQIPANVRDLGRDQVEVIEEPVGCGFDKVAVAYVVGQRAVCGPEHADIVFKPRKRIARAPARIGIDGEPSGERERALLEPLHAFRAAGREWPQGSEKLRRTQCYASTELGSCSSSSISFRGSVSSPAVSRAIAVSPARCA